MDWENFAENVGGAAMSGIAGIGDAVLDTAKGKPGVGSAVSLASSMYHGNAAYYSASNGNRDNAVGHGAQAVVNGLGAIPMVGDVMGIADGVLSHAGGAARLANEHLGLGVPEEALPMSVAEGASNLAIGATNLIFGEEDKTNNKGSRHGEVAAGMSGMLLGPAAPFLFNGAGEAWADLWGSDKKEGSVGAGPENKAGKYGAKVHDDIMKNGPGGLTGPHMPKIGDTAGSGGTGAGPTKTGSGPTSDGSPYGGGHGGADTKAGKGSSFSTSPSPMSHGSPGIQPGAADGTIRPSHENQLIGPGGLIGPQVGPADAQMTPDAPMPYGIQPKASPAGPMPYGVQPKGNGAPMSGPMPKMPWFLEPAGPSTW